ncbi:unnamed protein product, partial [Staurois parvus]
WGSSTTSGVVCDEVSLKGGDKNGRKSARKVAEPAKAVGRRTTGVLEHLSPIALAVGSLCNVYTCGHGGDWNT